LVSDTVTLGAEHDPTFETPETTQATENEEDYVRYEIIWKNPEGACTWWGPPPTKSEGGSGDPNLEGEGDVIFMYDKDSRKMMPLPAGFVAPAHIESLWD
jgi:hypothetical protein